MFHNIIRARRDQQLEWLTSLSGLISCNCPAAAQLHAPATPQHPAQDRPHQLTAKASSCPRQQHIFQLLPSQLVLSEGPWSPQCVPSVALTRCSADARAQSALGQSCLAPQSTAFELGDFTPKPRTGSLVRLLLYCAHRLTRSCLCERRSRRAQGERSSGSLCTWAGLAVTSRARAAADVCASHTAQSPAERRPCLLLL